MPEIFNHEQGTPEWFQARSGIPTASQFSAILAKGQGKTRKAYMNQLAGEIITGDVAESFSNAHTERGHQMEPDAREEYSFLTGNIPEQVGFIRNGQKGCSPDSLIDTTGMLEIKTKLPKLLIDCILKDEFPSEHKAQCQGALWVAERDWIDIAIYWPGLPLFIKRAERDESYISDLSEAVDKFNEELAGVVDQIRAYGAAA